jgi:hypothetical protein
LEQVKIPLINEGYLNRRPAQRLSSIQPPKTTTDNYNMMQNNFSIYSGSKFYRIYAGRAPE